MVMYTRQVECLNCSNSRNFVHHSEASQRQISQADVGALPKEAVLSCGRCGSFSLIACWGDAVPYATTGYVARRRRRRKNADGTLVPRT
ncbi:MAG TPA: hypothetical protein VIJ28_00780 [Chloroflexota bacterium]|jgi:hypothetical protein|nr:hypothetical protein [Chloroflexota bacterium]